MRGLLGCLAALLCAGSVQAADPLWHWIWVTPAPDPTQGWTTFEGQAPVAFDGVHLSAILEGHSEEWQPKLQVKGLVTGHTIIEAVVTHVGADPKPERYHGAVLRTRSKPTDPTLGWGVDRIWLNAGPNHIGLYREVPPAK